MTKTWTFSQARYPGVDQLGVCAALCARWSKMMLKARKDDKFAPSITEQDRNLYFNKANVPEKIAAVQARFDEKAKRNVADLQTVGIAHRATKVIEEQVPDFDALNLRIAVSQGLDRIKENSDIAFKEVLSANKLTGSDESRCTGFSTYFTGCEAGCCYIFFSGALEHATAAFVTGGRLWWDYYFFDPNAGEFRASGLTDLNGLMGQFQAAYKNEGAAQRVRVALA